jgi:putative acetyltransferase
MEIRAYHLGKEHEIWHLFHQTVHHVNAQHYTKKQLDAWSPSLSNKILGNKKLAKLGSFVCVNEKKISGYSDLQTNGYIDHFFCQRQYQGVGEALMTHIYILAQ